MSENEFDSIKRTRIGSAPIIDPNASATQSWFNIANQTLSLAQDFGNEAKQEAADAGKLAGENSVSLNPDGSISRAQVGDAGKFYTKAYMGAQRVAAKNGLETSIRARAQEFLTEHQNNPDAIAKFEDEFKKGYLEPLVGGLNKDIQGQVGVVAELVYRGGLNSLSDIEMRRSFEVNKVQYEQGQTADLNNLREAYVTGNTALAAKIEEKLYGDAQEANGGGDGVLLTVAGIEQLNKNMIIAKESGSVINKSKNMNPVAAMQYFKKYQESAIDGLGAADKAKIVADGEAELSRRLQIRNQMLTEKTIQLREPLAMASALLAEARMQLSNGQFLRTFQIDKIFEKAGLKNEMNDPTVSEFYYRNALQSRADGDAAMQEVSKNDAFFAGEKIEAGTMTYTNVVNSPGWDRYSPESRRALWNSEMVRMKKQFDFNEKVDLHTMDLLIQNEEFSLEHLNAILRDPSDPRYKFMVENSEKITTKVTKYLASDTFKYKLAVNTLSKTGEIPKDLRAAHDREYLKSAYGGQFNSQDKNHIEKGFKDIAIFGYVPVYMEPMFDNWKSLLRDQNVGNLILEQVSALGQANNIGALDLLPAELSDQNNVNRLRAIMGLPPEAFKTAIIKEFTKDPTDLSNQEEKRRLQEKYYGSRESGWFGPSNLNRGQELVLGELQRSINAGTSVGVALDGIFGRGGPLRAIIPGIDGREMLEGTNVIPKSIRGFLSNPEGMVADNPTIVNRIADMAYAYELAGVNRPVQKALAALATEGGGFSAVAEPGKIKLVSQSFEQKVQNLGMEVSPAKYLYSVLQNHAEEISKTMGEKDFGPDWFWGRLFSREVEIVDFSEMRFFDSFGPFGGGDLGTDAKEQIKNFARFEQAYMDGKIEVKSFNERSGAFQLTFTLGSKDGSGEPIRVTMNDLLLTVDRESRGLVAQENVKQEVGRNAVSRFFSASTSLSNAVTPRLFNSEDAAVMKAWLDMISRTHIQAIQDEESRSGAK
jgi:hypothetical protein